MERKLASVRTIKELIPIENSDFIELAKIDGWQCIVKKGEFKVGDKCVYFEIDSFLPLREEFEFLRKSSYKKMDNKEGFRLRTIKLRGQLSQGLALPLSSFPELSEVHVGADVTNDLGVLKYEKPIPPQLHGKVKRYFPSFLKKTDQERVQNLSEEILEGFWLMTEKLDGTSFTCYKYKGEFGVCSRNLELKETEENLYWKIAREYSLQDKCPDGFAIQGEIVGPGIQYGGYTKKPTLFVFHIWDIEKQEYLPLIKAERWAMKLGLEFVPVIGVAEITPDVDRILKMAEGVSSIDDKTEMEGVVFYKDPFSFKAISNKYLLKTKS